jgi:hypothetical protein
VSALTAAAPGLYADDPRSFGMPLKGADDPADPAGEQGPVATGHVFVGLADILGLEMAADIRSTRGAEAGVFDPALVKLLAKSYSLGEPEGSSLASAAAGSAASLSDVAKACKRNLDAATAAGLKCRAAVWSNSHARQCLTLSPAAAAAAVAWTIFKSPLHQSCSVHCCWSCLKGETASTSQYCVSCLGELAS